MGRDARLALFCPALALLLAGCVAETVRKNPPRRGPVKEVGYVDLGGGEVRYSTDGWSWFVAGRRRAAGALMRHVCGKLKPVIVEEFAQEDADVPYSQEDIEVTMQRGDEHFILASYRHLVFECARASDGVVVARQARPKPTLAELLAKIPVSTGTVAAAAPAAAPAVAVAAASTTLAAAPAPQEASAAISTAVVAAAPAEPATPAPPPAPVGAIQARSLTSAAWVALPFSWSAVPAAPAKSAKLPSEANKQP